MRYRYLVRHNVTVDRKTGDIMLTEEGPFHPGDAGIRLVNVTIKTRENAVREGLIALGWTPPENNGESDE